MDTAAPTTEVPVTPKPTEHKVSVVPDPIAVKPKGKKKSLSKGRRKAVGKPGKIHIRLPAIEAYEKEICFPAEAPGRVVVRLERLMGSDKIRPVDEKYMSTLIQRLEEEEMYKFDRKIRLRKKAEKERHRQLAINGLMEPGPGMEDLFNHPVFRVNRILSRLSRLDNNFANKPGEKLPPISQIDPFKYDDTGKYFCDYPTHVALRKQCEQSSPKGAKEDEQLHEVLSDMAETRDASSKTDEDFIKAKTAQMVATAPPPPSQTNIRVQREEEDESETDEELEGGSYTGEEEDEEEEGLTEMEEAVLGLSREYMESLTTLQNRYGVPQTDGLEEMWKPYKSEMVEQFYSDEGAMEELYSSAKGLFEVYVRQDLTSREYVKTTPLKLPTQQKEAEAVEAEEEDEGENEQSPETALQSDRVEENVPDLTPTEGAESKQDETQNAEEQPTGEAAESIEPGAPEVGVEETEQMETITEDSAPETPDPVEEPAPETSEPVVEPAPEISEPVGEPPLTEDTEE